MPAISKIRFTNVIYENGGKRYNDELFQFDGHNGAIVLENGGGKTVFIQTAIQAVVPHMDLAERKVKETLSLENDTAHIAIEWILNDKPRRYAVTAVTLFIENNAVNSYKYAYEYGGEDPNNLENIPFIRENANKSLRPASKGEMLDYYQKMAKNYMGAKLFDTIIDYHTYIEEHYKIIPSEWRKIGVVNSAEGDVDRYFDGCKTTTQLLNRLLIPVVEEAIEGTYKTDFVKTFEKQREHFRKNKILLEQIRESQETREQLEKYIEVSSKLHQKEMAYLDTKRETKALFQYVENTLESQKQQVVLLDEKLRNLEERGRQYEKKKLSFKILERQLEIESITKALDTIAIDYNKQKEAYDTYVARKQNIEITKLQEEIHTITLQIEEMENLLDRIERDEELQDLMGQLEENSSQLRSAFEEQLSKLDKEKSLISQQKDRYGEELEACQKALQEAGVLLQETSSKKASLEALQGRLEQEMAQVAQETFEQEEMERPEEILIEAQERLNTIKSQTLKIEGDMQNEAAEKQQLLLDLRDNRRKKEALQLQENHITSQLEHFEGEQDKLFMKIEPFVRVSSSRLLYEKQGTIETVIIEKEVQQSKRKEAALKEERLCSRLVDQYEEAKFYTADPLLLRIYEELKGMTDYIELGTQFHESMVNNQTQLSFGTSDMYPYWTLTLITTDKDLDLVQKHLHKYSKEITHPVAVLTLDQARDLNQGKDQREDTTLMIFPKLWTDLLDKTSFDTWKAELFEVVEEKRKSRIEEEQAYAKLVALRQEVYTFYKDFSKGAFDELKQAYDHNHTALEELDKILIRDEERILIIDQNGILFNQKLMAYKDEMYHLTHKVTSIKRYIEKAKELNHHKEALFKVKELCEKATYDKKRLEQNLKSHQDILEDLKSKLQEIQGDMARIWDTPLYQEVKGADLNPTGLPLKVIIERRKTLEDLVNGKNQDRFAILSRSKEKKEELAQKKDDLGLKEQEAAYPIQPISNYYTKELSDLIDQIKKLDKSLTLIKVEVDRTKTELAVAQSTKVNLTKDCVERYGDVVVFTEDLLTIQNQLEEDRKLLKKEKDGVWQERLRTTDQITLFDRNLHHLNTLNYRHDFMSVELDVYEMAEGTLNPSGLTATIDQLDKALDGQKRIFDGQKTEVENEKNRFKRYCNHYINDTKLKEMVISGIDHKTDYQDLKEFGDRMLERISHIIRLAEHDRTTSDQELQIFLEHLYAYVNTVVEELRTIQKKTQIRIENTAKQIFIFDIPLWEEAAAKDAIRKHIDWIIDQLENPQNETRDELTTQKNLEGWLSVKQLLGCILGDQTIKIKCRKVTNDMKISSLPSSWEHSNQWSGGEKWSKNMTLFLGILIYIAEKKQYLSNSDKKHRVVILDNPFGKASSKHVLDPVFFIAESLGFQIIALTAHAEGEFIRSYFPVVYSCKLRTSADPSKQIMTKQKEIHYAYLKERDPSSLVRFQEVDQMTVDALFGM